MNAELDRRQFFVLGAAFGVSLISAITLDLTSKVKVKVNGLDMEVPKGATIDQVMELANFQPRQGNYTSVSGNILKKGAGWKYLAEIDGKAYHENNHYRIKGGEVVLLKDGDNKLEPHTVTYKEEEPKLIFSGLAGGTISYISQWPQKGKVEILHGTRTGETAPGKVVSKLQDCIVTTANVSPKSGQKLVGLTFDDGPSKYTETYLKILKEKGATATFFNLGKNIEEMPEISRKIVKSGNQIASHSYSHPQLTKIPADDMRKQLTETQQIIKKATGVQTTMFRPPYGSFDHTTWLESKGVVSAEVLWSQDSLDWKRQGVESILAGAMKNVTNGSVILMHDGGGNRDQDVQALPLLLDKLKEEGYQVVSLEKLFASDPSIPKDIANGKAGKPTNCDWPKTIGKEG